MMTMRQRQVEEYARYRLFRCLWEHSAEPEPHARFALAMQLAYTAPIKSEAAMMRWGRGRVPKYQRKRKGP